jgi:FkbM family methyltransferase
MKMPAEPVDSVVVHGPAGQDLVVNAGELRGLRLVETSAMFNPGSLQLWQLALDLFDWDLVADIGCNYGQMIACVDLGKFKRIVAFEPSDAVLPYLRSTISNLDWSVELHEVAVADRDESAVPFAVDLSWSGSSTLGSHLEDDAAGHDFMVEQVPTVTLDSTFHGSSIQSACLKIDVEGRERLVMAGGSAFLAGLERSAVMVEILHMTSDQVTEFAEGWELCLLDMRLNQVVRLPKEPAAARELIDSGWLYRQDALLLRGIDLDGPDSTSNLTNSDWPVARINSAISARDMMIDQLTAERDNTESELRAWYSSRSFTLTKPLRAVSGLRTRLRRVFRPSDRNDRR